MAKKYLYIAADNILAEIIPDEDPVFPGVAISERFSPEFITMCVVRTDEQIAEEGIEIGMVYDKESDKFSKPPEPEPIPEPEPEGYTITEEEVSAAYEEGVNNVE